ncbi:MAG: ATP-binding protein [Dehalococcoidia bacterium]
MTRVEPEIFVAPFPGEPVFKSEGDQRDEALYFDKMLKDRTAFCVGFSRDGQLIYGNAEFLDGRLGAHMNISGISGVATKTSYALFLLYSLLNSEVIRNPANSKAIIFNVKGEDLLWLDKPNCSPKLDAAARERYQAAGLPVGPFPSVGIWAPVHKDLSSMMPGSETRTEGVRAYAWSLAEFCRERLLRFLFAEGDNETSQLSFVIRLVEEWLADRRPGAAVSEPDERGFLTISSTPRNAPSPSDATTIRSFHELAEAIERNIDRIAERAAGGTHQAFIRRLFDAVGTAGHLVRAIPPREEERHRIRVLDDDGAGGNNQVTVIDINSLPDRAKRFVVGVVVRRLVQQKEAVGSGGAQVFLVLDELNKYAPREGWSPIKEVILDIAERGRSLGVILIGAQQTASEIERRVTANAAFRVAGRLDTAEAARPEYGFLTDAAKARSSILKPGTMFIHQPEIPVPLLVQFPFPAWATRKDEVDDAASEDAPGLRGKLL